MDSGSGKRLRLSGGSLTLATLKQGGNLPMIENPAVVFQQLSARIIAVRDSL
jgi:hypothetical protein